AWGAWSPCRGLGGVPQLSLLPKGVQGPPCRGFGGVPQLSYLPISFIRLSHRLMKPAPQQQARAYRQDAREEGVQPYVEVGRARRGHAGRRPAVAHRDRGGAYHGAVYHQAGVGYLIAGGQDLRGGGYRVGLVARRHFHQVNVPEGAVAGVAWDYVYYVVLA